MRLTDAMRPAHDSAMNPITALRNNSGLSQEAFATSIGCAQSTVSRWESGEQSPDLDALRKLAKIGLDVGDYMAWRMATHKVAA